MEYDRNDSNNSDNSDTPPNYKNNNISFGKQENPNEYTFSNNNNNPNKKDKLDKSTKNKRSDDTMNEDNALEIIEIEFDELKEWVKFKTRFLRRECLDIIDSIKLSNKETPNPV